MREFGKYRLQQRLGRGSFADVWKASVTTLDGAERQVALKVVHEQALEGEGSAMGSVINEAILGAQLRHPCIVEILEFGYVKEDLYIAMELVEGITLRQWLSQRKNQALPLPVCLEIGRCVALALQHAHEHGSGPNNAVVHLDLKPENILIGWDGRVKLSDFGIARWAGNVYDTAAPGMIQGSPHYMSPEQIDNPKRVGPPSDRFSFATAMLEILTGQQPYDVGELPLVLDAIRRAEPTAALESVRERCPELFGVLRRLIDPDPDQRPHRTGQVAEVFAELTRRYPLQQPLHVLIKKDFPDAKVQAKDPAYPSFPTLSPGVPRGEPSFTDTYASLQAWSVRRSSPWVTVAWFAVAALLAANALMAWKLFG